MILKPKIVLAGFSDKRIGNLVSASLLIDISAVILFEKYFIHFRSKIFFDSSIVCCVYMFSLMKQPKCF